MKPIRYLGKNISKSQVAALTYALTEGSVGPGCDGHPGSSVWLARGGQITKATITYLIGAGLATAKPDTSSDGFWANWVVLTELGKVIAHKAYFESRGRAWMPPTRSL